MIAIDIVLVSDEIVEEHFVCDLLKCKGGCCVDGDCGAPLTQEEAETIAQIYPIIKSTLPMEHVPEIERHGTHVIDSEHGLVTPTINGGVCVYGIFEEGGIVLCGIEKAWKEGKISFRKPISCHLFPIRIKKYEGFETANYEPREDLCSAACKLGSHLKVPVYKFLQEAITRNYGTEFYETLDAVAQKMKNG